MNTVSIENLFNHLCDIYHLQIESFSQNYGLPEAESYFYAPEPDLAGVSCHFGVKSQNVSVNQTEPANVMESRIKLTLPEGTDVRINDKIIDCSTGCEYTAEQPVNVRNHHIFVYVRLLGVNRKL